METGHLNAFMPYEHKPLDHEDQLTRAFLVLVRCVKMVEVTFLELLTTRMAEAGIEIRPPTLTHEAGGLESVETQAWSSTKARLASESGRLVSVVITDERLDPKHRVQRTERVAVYDGLLKFRPDWVFVVENKLDHTNIWPEQLSSAFSENYEVEPIPLVLTWREIISRLSLLTENELVQDAGAALVNDFLQFIWSEFPELNPYHRFRLCRDNPYLLDQRCLAIMRQTKLGPVEYHRGWHYSIRLEDKPGIKEVALYTDAKEGGGWEIVLALYPGDTMSQARALYESIQEDKIAPLRDGGWSVRPNFHLAYRSSNLYWPETRLSTEEYIRYWRDRVRRGELQQLPRADWDRWFAIWQTDGIISAADVEEIRQSIAVRGFPTLNVCPGLGFIYKWDSERAEAKDDEGDTAFARELTARIADLTATW